MSGVSLTVPASVTPLSGAQTSATPSVSRNNVDPASSPSAQPSVPSGPVVWQQVPLRTGEEYKMVTLDAVPLYDEEKHKGPIQVSIPEFYLQYKPRLSYVGSPAIIYFNFQDLSFYERAAQLPAPRLRVWVLQYHKGFETDATYVKRRLIEESFRLNVEMMVVNPDKIDLQVSMQGFDGVVYEGTPYKLPDCVICRVSAAVGYFGLAVLRQLESMGVRVFNNMKSIEKSRDKLWTHQILAGNGIAIPKTVLGKFPIEYEFIEKEFGYPVVMKRTSGSKGEQVWKLDSREELQALELKLEDKNKPYIFQEFLSHTRGRDIRVFTIGDKVAAAMMRVAPKGQFKANFHQGGTVKSTKIKRPLERMALTTAALCGLEFAGVDVLIDKDSYKVCEVNSSPGFEGLEKASGVNVAGQVMEYVMKCMAARQPRKSIVEEPVPIQDDHLPAASDLASPKAGPIPGPSSTAPVTASS